MSEHVPATESNFLSDGWRAKCSCGWIAADSDGVSKLYTAEEYAIAAAQRHAVEAANEEAV